MRSLLGGQSGAPSSLSSCLSIVCPSLSGDPDSSSSGYSLVVAGVGMRKGNGGSLSVSPRRDCKEIQIIIIFLLRLRLRPRRWLPSSPPSAPPPSSAPIILFDPALR